MVCVLDDDIRSDGQVVNFRLAFPQKVINFRMPKPDGVGTGKNGISQQHDCPNGGKEEIRFSGAANSVEDENDGNRNKRRE
jgi:hypothetical protein